MKISFFRSKRSHRLGLSINENITLILILSFIITRFSTKKHISGINVKFYLPDYDAYPKGLKWFNELPHLSMKKFLVKLPKSRLLNALITMDKFETRTVVHPKLALKSIVYMTHFTNAYLSPLPSLKHVAIKTYNWGWIETRPQKTVASYPNGIYYVQRFHMWGHLIHDFLCCLMFVPEEILQLHPVTFVPFSGRASAMLWMNFLGLDEYITLIDLNGDENIFVWNLYTFNGYEYVHGYTIGGMPKLRELIRKRVDIGRIKPTKFAIVNRPKELGRRFENIEELKETLTNSTTIDEGCQWEIIDGLPGNTNITKIAFLWATFKVLVAPCGSMIYNSIFMHNKTGMCLLFTKTIDDPNLHLAIASNIFLIGVVHTGYWNLFRGSNTHVKEMAKYTQRVIDAVNNGGWTSTADLRAGFDERDVYKFYDDDVGMAQ